LVCASSDEAAVKKVMSKATTLQFEFSSSSAAGPAAAAAAPGGSSPAAEGARALTSVKVPSLDSFSESEHQILGELVRRYKVPQAHRCVALLARGEQLGRGGAGAFLRHSQRPVQCLLLLLIVFADGSIVWLLLCLQQV
jgi:hypothetical protein